MKHFNRPRPLSSIVPGIAKDIFGKKSMLFGKMLAEWAQIAGPEVAARAVPLDLKYTVKRKSSNISAIPTVAAIAHKDQQAVLHLAVQPGFALEFSYQKALLIERLNMFFGYAAISDIKIIQHSEIMNNKAVHKPPSRPVTRQEELEIDLLVAQIPENDLQTALKNLGKAIISRH